MFICSVSKFKCMGLSQFGVAQISAQPASEKSKNKTAIYIAIAVAIVIVVGLVVAGSIWIITSEKGQGNGQYGHTTRRACPFWLQ